MATWGFPTLLQGLFDLTPGYRQEQLPAARQSGYGGPYGAPAAPARAATPARGPFDWALPLPPGGFFGQQKWTGGNGIDIFVPRGTPVYAMFDGEVRPYGIPGPGYTVPGFVLAGDNGYTMQGLHVQPIVTGRVQRGQQIAVVDDPGLSILGAYPGTPGGDFQHLDLTLGRGRGPLPITGGDLNASQVLQQLGYGRPAVAQTRGPNAGPLGMMGMGMPGMGMGPMGGLGMMGLLGGGAPWGPGMGMGMPGMGGMGMGMPGMGMPGMGMGMGMGGMGFPGMGMGMPGMGGMGMPGMGMPGMGGMGMPGMPGMGFPGMGLPGLGGGVALSGLGGSYSALGRLFGGGLGLGPRPFGGGGVGGLFGGFGR